jgi:hypothetical protein
MKHLSCEHEIGVIRALHSGEWTSELRLHVEECQDCGQSLRLAEALRQTAAHAQVRCSPPDPHWILQRARRMARAIALRRIALLMAAMRTLAALYVIAVAAWLMRGYAALQYREVAASMHGANSEIGLLGALAAAVCVAAGLFPILRGGSEPG